MINERLTETEQAADRGKSAGKRTVPDFRKAPSLFEVQGMCGITLDYCNNAAQAIKVAQEIRTPATVHSIVTATGMRKMIFSNRPGNIIT